MKVPGGLLNGLPSSGNGYSACRVGRGRGKQPTMKANPKRVIRVQKCLALFATRFAMKKEHAAPPENTPCETRAADSNPQTSEAVEATTSVPPVKEEIATVKKEQVATPENTTSEAAKVTSNLPPARIENSERSLSWDMDVGSTTNWADLPSPELSPMPQTNWADLPSPELSPMPQMSQGWPPQIMRGRPLISRGRPQISRGRP